MAGIDYKANGQAEATPFIKGTLLMTARIRVKGRHQRRNGRTARGKQAAGVEIKKAKSIII
ncbi:hypothetical protein [Peribacillus simplex]|uniref:hypothetical protein n=1 Tax=Peribacillus simplex TaxID=1478 RepID=UPI003D2AA063